MISVGVALGQSVLEAMAYLNDVAQFCPSAANITRYAALVRDRAPRRALLAVSGKLNDMALRPALVPACRCWTRRKRRWPHWPKRAPQSIEASMEQYMQVVDASERGEVGAHGISPPVWAIRMRRSTAARTGASR